MSVPTLLRLAVAGVALVATSGIAAADETGATQVLHFRNTGADCAAADNPFLSAERGTTDINCGYIGGGLPFGEVFVNAEQDASRTFSTPRAPKGAPVTTFRLDDARNLVATMVVQAGSQQGQALPGTGQVRVVLDLVAQTATGKTIPLGSGDAEALATPPARTTEITLDLDLADSVGDVDLVGITATATVRGVHVFHGFLKMNDTQLALPLQAPAE